ncbi:hypothetical protein ACGFIF_44180 [Kribbella sp. NPDC049174]|uniref:hypothetical protein n=1 Tax=Kribbella sp. NPDC049174 TaxID=3364112 RepID=UPI0037141423
MANVPVDLMPRFAARLEAMQKSASWYLVELVRRDLETYDENTPLPEWWDDVEAQGSLIQLRPGGGFTPLPEAVAATDATHDEEDKTATKTG